MAKRYLNKPTWFPNGIKTSFVNGVYYAEMSGARFNGTTDDGLTLYNWIKNSVTSTSANPATIIWPSGKTVLIGSPIPLKSGLRNIGNGCTLKRANAISGTITADLVDSGSGVSSATLSTVTGLYVGQWIAFSNAADRQKITYRSKIATINATTKVVTFSPTTSVYNVSSLDGTVSGNTTISSGGLFTTVTNFFMDDTDVESDCSDILIEGFSFDGNGTNNSVLPAVRYENTQAIQNDFHGTGKRNIVRNCRFKNEPCEVMVLPAYGAQVSNIIAEWDTSIAYGGNVIHFTSDSTSNINDFTVSDIIARNAHQGGLYNGHLDGVITSSAACQYGVISNVAASGCNALASPLDAAATGWQFMNCTSKNMTKALRVCYSAAGAPDGVSFLDCYWENTTAAKIDLQGNASGSITNLKFTNCHFKNCYMVAQYIDGFDFIGSRIVNAADSANKAVTLDSVRNCNWDAYVEGGTRGVEIASTTASYTTNVRISGTIKNQCPNPAAAVAAIYAGGTLGASVEFNGVNIIQQDLITNYSFTASVGGATSGTLTAAITNGTYFWQFSNGQFRTVVVTGGTAADWSGDGALSAGTITAAASADVIGVYMATGGVAIRNCTFAMTTGNRAIYQPNAKTGNIYSDNNFVNTDVGVFPVQIIDSTNMVFSRNTFTATDNSTSRHIVLGGTTTGMGFNGNVFTKSVGTRDVELTTSVNCAFSGNTYAYYSGGNPNQSNLATAALVPVFSSSASTNDTCIGNTMHLAAV